MREDDAAPARLAIRWWLVALVALSGLLAMGLPYFLGDAFGSWEVITTATLTNVGTTLLLASALFFLERTFTRRVSAVARSEASSAVAKETGDLRAATVALEARLDRISDLVQAQESAETSRLDGLVADMSQEVSFRTVTALLEEAWNLRSIPEGLIIVPAGGPRSPRVRFYWGETRFGSATHSNRPAVVLELVLNATPPGRKYQSVVEARWTPEATAGEVVMDLRRAARQAGLVEDAVAIDASQLFAHLRTALAAAIKSRRQPDFWLQGQLLEWIGDDLAVTDCGVFSQNYGQVIRGDDLPARHSIGRDSSLQLDVPEWADSEIWLRVRQSVEEFLPAQQLPAGYDSGRIPYGRTHPAPPSSAI